MADILSNAFKIGLSVSNDVNDTSTQHPRQIDFKGRHLRSGEQTRRRKDILDRQKRSRFDAVNYARKLVDGDLLESDYDEASMEISQINEEQKEKNQRMKKYNPYKNQLMLSEWVVDPPTDLNENWIMVVCPVGKRVLVVAHKGHTTAYTKSGYSLNKFHSLLPGGSFKTWSKAKHKFTLVDCIYDEVNRTFWMLDLMCLNGHPIYDSETDFRFFWLNSKLSEDSPGITEQSNINPFKFKPCPYVPCTNESIVNAATDMYPFKIDGVLFYHKLAHYRPGRNPLVGWLKTHMIPEILDIPMPLSIMQDSPVDFNRIILKDANKELQHTLCDRSFDNPKKTTPKKSEKEKMDT